MKTDTCRTKYQRKTQNTALEEAYLNYYNSKSEEELENLFTLITPLVRHFVRHFSGGRFDQDMQQAGYEGCIKAVHQYRTGYNSSFATYAGHCIMGEIRHYIRRELRYYRPRVLEGLQEKAQGITADYYADHGAIPSKSELSKALNVKEEGIDEIMAAGLVSIDKLELDKISCIHYESFKLPVEDKIVLEQAFKKLTEIKQQVVYYLFFRGCSQKQVADKLGLNQKKVSRLLQSSLEEMQKTMCG